MVIVCIGETQGRLVYKVSGHSLKGAGQGSDGHIFHRRQNFQLKTLIYCCITACNIIGPQKYSKVPRNYLFWPRRFLPTKRSKLTQRKIPTKCLKLAHKKVAKRPRKLFNSGPQKSRKTAHKHRSMCLFAFTFPGCVSN